MNIAQAEHKKICEKVCLMHWHLVSRYIILLIVQIESQQQMSKILYTYMIASDNDTHDKTYYQMLWPAVSYVLCQSKGSIASTGAFTKWILLVSRKGILASQKQYHNVRNVYVVG